MKREKHLGLLITPEMHYKLHYIAKYEGRSASGHILYLINRNIADFEKTVEKIELPEKIGS